MTEIEEDRAGHPRSTASGKGPLELLRKGFRVIVHGRSDAKVAATIDELKEQAPKGELLGWSCDLSSLAQVREKAPELLSIAPRLEVLLPQCRDLPARPRHAGGVRADPGGEPPLALLADASAPARAQGGGAGSGGGRQLAGAHGRRADLADHLRKTTQLRRVTGRPSSATSSLRTGSPRAFLLRSSPPTASIPGWSAPSCSSRDSECATAPIRWQKTGWCTSRRRRWRRRQRALLRPFARGQPALGRKLGPPARAALEAERRAVRSEVGRDAARGERAPAWALTAA